MNFFDSEFSDKELIDIAKERQKLINSIDQNKKILDKYTDVSSLFVSENL